ncbi:hypothetical protein GW17_00024295 [Ensete ventricosum]|nr:hypothetical protein GW17_00024295 [Ensete ventricosum]
MPPSPALYVRQTDEESGGGSGRRASGDGSSGDWFDIPPKNASVERLRRWRVCFLDPVAGFLMSGCLRAMVKGLSDLLNTNLDRGISGDDAEILHRRNIFGANTYPRKKGRSFWVCYAVLRFDLYRPIWAVCIGPTGYRYADHPLPDGTIEIGRRRSISTVGGRLREKEEEGEEEKGEKREIPALPRFLARSVARERSFAGGLPSSLREKGRETRRELPTQERGDASMHCVYRSILGIIPYRDVLFCDISRALKKVGMTVEVLHLLLFWLLWSQVCFSSRFKLLLVFYPLMWYDAVSVSTLLLASTISDYRQSLQFQNLNEEKRNIQLEVSPSAHESIPADGVVITGHSLAIDESSMTGESKIVSAAEIVLASCTSWLDADGSKQPLTSDKDPCRPGVKAAVDLCTKAGVKLSVLNIITLSVNGYYLNLISLQVMGRSSPSDKLLLVQALRKRGHVVAVTGDGTNDAPALHEVCIHVSEVLSLCCSTLTEKISLFFFLFPFSFTLLYQVVRWGRSVYANIQKFIQFQLTVNVAALIINVVAAVSSGNVPLNAVQVG